MPTVICPGFHSSSLTQQFVEELTPSLGSYRIFPTERYPAPSAVHLLHYLKQQFRQSQPSVSPILIGFSAGVVAAAGAACVWQRMGGGVRALIAVDGWGVPLFDTFPIHRISHDYFTHWSSAWLGAGLDSFYADPPVDHLNLWRSPQLAHGWRVSPSLSQSDLAETNLAQTHRSARSNGDSDRQEGNPAGNGCSWIGQVFPPGPMRTRTTAADFLTMLLNRYQEL